MFDWSQRGLFGMIFKKIITLYLARIHPKYLITNYWMEKASAMTLLIIQKEEHPVCKN